MSPTPMSPQATLQWLGCAGWRIQYKDTVLVADPYLSRPPGVQPFPVPEESLADADVLVCTHGHFDHAMDLERVARLSGAPVWAPEVVCERLEKHGVDPTLLHANEHGFVGRVGDIGLEVIPSHHIRFDVPLVAETLWAAIKGRTFWEILDLGLANPMGSNSDFLLHLGPRTVLLSGSLGQTPARLRAVQADVALLPYNGRTDMPRRMARAADALRPRLLVFHHYDDFYPHFAPPQDPSEALPMLRRQFPDMRFLVADYGGTFTLDPHFSS